LGESFAGVGSVEGAPRPAKPAVAYQETARTLPETGEAPEARAACGGARVDGEAGADEVRVEGLNLLVRQDDPARVRDAGEPVLEEWLLVEAVHLALRLL